MYNMPPVNRRDYVAAHGFMGNLIYECEMDKLNARIARNRVEQREESTMTIEDAWKILDTKDRGEWVDCCDIDEAYRVISKAINK